MAHNRDESDRRVRTLSGSTAVAALSAELAGLVNGQALILAYADATLAIAIIAFLGVPLVFLMRKAKPAAASSAAPTKAAPPSPVPNQQAA
jgi:hypothetical protein